MTVHTLCAPDSPLTDYPRSKYNTTAASCPTSGIARGFLPYIVVLVYLLPLFGLLFSCSLATTQLRFHPYRLPSPTVSKACEQQIAYERYNPYSSLILSSHLLIPT